MPAEGAAGRVGDPRRLTTRRLRGLLPALTLTVMLAVIFRLQPRAMSYLGLRLLLSFAPPLMFAAMAELAVIAAGDIDLGLGPFIGLVNVISARWFAARPLLGAGALIAAILAYAGMGVFIAARRLPSIVVTLGASFVWLGLALIILPTPGGSAPSWLAGLVRLHPPFVPLPILLAVALALFGHWLFMRSAYGVILRATGGAPAALARAGWSLIRARAALYGLAGLFGSGAGLLLTGINTTGDANFGTPYTLLAIAAVIIGGGEFSGGVVAPVGAVIGAFIMLLTGSLLSFLNVSTDWQLAVQGGLLILVLATRALARRQVS